MRRRSNIRAAAARLTAALRRMAGMPSVNVKAEYRDGRIRIVDIDFGGGRSYPSAERLRGNPDPPKADMAIKLDTGEYEFEIAKAEWDGRGNITGEIDPDEAANFAASENDLGFDITWDEWSDHVGAGPPSNQPLLWDGAAPPDHPTNELLAVRSASGAKFVDALEAWIDNLRNALATLASFSIELVRCDGCEKVVPTGETIDAWGNSYCMDCAPSTCDECGIPIPDDETFTDDGGTFCEECFRSSRASIYEEVREAFYAEHPELESIDALEKAAHETEMDPEAYVAIFRDLTWSDGYGGKAWARIAETWRDLDEAVRQEDWEGMHLLTDHAFDLVHNNGSLFTKAKKDVQSWLFRALEDKYFLDPLQYRDKLSPDAKRVLDAYIRNSGGVRKWKEGIEGVEGAMSRIERLLVDQDYRTADRLWRAHRLSPQMFRDRDSFLEVAFWREASSNEFPGRLLGDPSGKARAVRDFLRSPDGRTAAAAMSAIDPHICQAGTSHPAGGVLRQEFVPKLLGLAEQDAALLLSPNDSEPYWRKKWRAFLSAETRRSKEESLASASAALAAAFVKLALTSADFHDFYALSLVNCDALPDDMVGMCRGLQKVTSLSVARALLEILARAVVREARHVRDQVFG